jgi:phosphoglycolate phosphatase
MAKSTVRRSLLRLAATFTLGRMTFQAVLFDLDGTLLDTLGDLADATNAALRSLGFPEHPQAAYKYFVGDGVQMLLRRALPPEHCDEATVAEGVARMRAEYARCWNARTRPYSGIAQMLDTLSARGLRMAVLSNKPHEFTRLCVTELLRPWNFAAVLGDEPSRPKKPDPAGALQIAAQLQLAPEQFLYLGDTATDMRTATAAGMYAVGALWGFRGAEELLAGGAQVLVAAPQEVVGALDRS